MEEKFGPKEKRESFSVDELEEYLTHLGPDLSNPRSDFYRGGMSDWLETLQPKMEQAFTKNFSNFKMTANERDFIKNFLIEKYKKYSQVLVIIVMLNLPCLLTGRFLHLLT